MLKSLSKAISTRPSTTSGKGRSTSTTGELGTKVASQAPEVVDTPEAVDTPEQKLNQWIKAGYWVCVTVKEVSLCKSLF